MAPLDLVGGAARPAHEYDPTASGQAHERGIQRARANLRALEVAEDRHRPAYRLGGGAHVLSGLPVRGMVAVREVEAGPVHAPPHHRPPDRGRCAPGPHGPPESAERNPTPLPWPISSRP